MEDITKIKIDMTKLESKISSTKETTERIEHKLDKHIDAEENQIEKYRHLFDEFFEKADGRYSGKWIERFLIRIGWTILGVVVPAFLFFLYEIAKTH